MAFPVITRAAHRAVADVAPPPASALFAQAVRDNSNLELDWLWLATQATLAAEQRYCYERALYINPASVPARRALKQLPPAPVEDVLGSSATASGPPASPRTRPGLLLRWPLTRWPGRI